MERSINSKRKRKNKKYVNNRKKYSKNKKFALQKKNQKKSFMKNSRRNNKQMNDCFLYNCFNNEKVVKIRDSGKFRNVWNWFRIHRVFRYSGINKGWIIWDIG